MYIYVGNNKIQKFDLLFVVLQIFLHGKKKACKRNMMKLNISGIELLLTFL